MDILQIIKIIVIIGATILGMNGIRIFNHPKHAVNGVNTSTTSTDTVKQ